jgi:hypothetical protein
MSEAHQIAAFDPAMAANGFGRLKMAQFNPVDD